MNVAINTTRNMREWIYDAIWNHSSDKFICPCCKGEVVLKNGNVNKPHFAHKSFDDCDTFSSDMSDWHISWQYGFPAENREYVIELTLEKREYEHMAKQDNFIIRHYNEQYNPQNPLRPLITITHRADVCINGYVIEFQHSPISSYEFNERTWFYRRAGYKVVWLFDFMIEDIYCYKSNEYSDMWKWTRPKKTFVDFHVASDFNRKNCFLFFQLDGDFLTRVMWSKPKHIVDEFGDYEYTDSDFRIFSTYFKYDYSPNEFVQAINQRKIY